MNTQKWRQVEFKCIFTNFLDDLIEEDKSFYEGLVNVPSLNATIPYLQPENYEEFDVDHASIYTSQWSAPKFHEPVAANDEFYQ